MTLAAALARIAAVEAQRDKLAATVAVVHERLERSDWVVARELLRMIDAAARCRHCGALPEPDGDHSCPCPHPDETCPDHPGTEDRAVRARLDSMKAAAVQCCDAGRTAYPDACPWHPAASPTPTGPEPK